MIILTSILYLLISFIPVLAYILIIWSTTPWGSINLKTAFRYFITGIMSIGILLIWFDLFPKWQQPLFYLGPTGIYVMAFIQVALVEELSKYTSFRIGEKIRGKCKTKNDLPIGTMFYCGISALGFSFIENVEYATKYGGDVIISRSITAMMIHFLCGLIMGYWLSASRIPSKLENRSLMEILFIKRPLLKKCLYTVTGVGCAIILHGLYDYNIMSGGNIIDNYIIMLGAIIAVYLAAKDLNERYRDRIS